MEIFLTSPMLPRTAQNVNVYEAFAEWLLSLGVKRNYSSNLKSVNKHILAKVTNTEDFFSYLYVISFDVETKPITELIISMIDLEQKTQGFQSTLSAGTLDDCKSAVRQFYWFLVSKNKKSFVGVKEAPCYGCTDTREEITWHGEPRKELGADFRLKTQDRINKQADKPTNFPIRIIDQIANNAADWADSIGLPADHVARKVKQAKEQWVESSINNAIFLIDGNRQVRLSDVESIGTKENEFGLKMVFIRLKGSGNVHQVMTRTAEGEIKPMLLGSEEDLTSIALDHVYRMEDILKDLGGSLPFLNKVTGIIREHDTGNIRGAETRQAVINEIKNNFGKYANDMGDLISDLNKIGNVVSLEAIHKKDNLNKH